MRAIIQNISPPDYRLELISILALGMAIIIAYFLFSLALGHYKRHKEEARR